MRKAVVVAFIVVFAVCMVHFYYAEDHCPVHCPTRGGHLGHVHAHHACASSCLCFWSGLFGPETGEFGGSIGFEGLAAAANESVGASLFAVDIAHPPKVLPA
jgi:hypothetical protein